MSEFKLKSLGCPRGIVIATIFDKQGKLMGTGINRLDSAHAPCTCNDNVDTTKEGSKTCLAIHAEVIAIMNVWGAGGKASDMQALWSTRPPCKNCIKVLLATSIQEIVVTPTYDDRDNSKEVWESAGRDWSICNE